MNARSNVLARILASLAAGLFFGFSAKAQENRSSATSATSATSTKSDTSPTKDSSPATPATPAGHSYHGEIFNEGPRQRAYLMPGCGDVHMKITTKSAEAQKFFDQGLGQLHGFWYFESERSFRQAAALDPDCAMAYWGIAMANIENPKRAKGFIERAATKKASAGRYEQLWIDGLAPYLREDVKDAKQRKRIYITSLETIIHEFPDDVEAKAFLALRLWQFNSDLPIVSHQAVDALLDQVFAANPMHPAHHYRIHLWDGSKPARALGSAARCGQSSPTIAHMWHMPGHTFSNLKRYADAAWQQEASSRADHAHMIRDRVMPDEIHNYAHNQEWSIRNFNFIGDVGAALDLSKNMIELPRHPRYNMLANGGKSASYGRTRLLETLERNELWAELLALTETPYLEPTDLPEQQIRRIRAIGIAAFRLNNADLLKAQVVDLEQRLTKIEENKSKPADSPLNKGEHKGVSGPKPPMSAIKELAAISAIQSKLAEVGLPSSNPATKSSDSKPADPKQAEMKLAESKVADSKKAARSAAVAKTEAKAKQAKKSDPYENSLRKSLDELKAYQMLLAREKSKAAEAIERVDAIPRFQKALLLLQCAEGNKAEELRKKAEDLARQAVNSGQNEVLPLAAYVAVLSAVGKMNEAKTEFEKLRQIGSRIDDLRRPAFARLAPIAKELSFPEDWRMPSAEASDAGNRPALDRIGPRYWHPATAPHFAAPDATGRMVSLSEYDGRPVVVIFYLGYGCLHCVEQLKKFAPRAEEYKQAGIELVAISTDSVADLKTSLETLGAKEAYPIQLLSNEKKDIFKTYRAFDDFENQPLHGTFLIDGGGLIRWQDIRFEPFTDPDFLLGEAKRLLQIPTRFPQSDSVRFSRSR